MLWTVYLVFVLINAVDFVFTRKVVRFGGREFNPVMRYIIRRWGFRGVALFKTLFLVLVGSQVAAGTMDLFTLCYLSFVYLFVLYLMYRDARSVGLSLLSPGA